MIQGEGMVLLIGGFLAGLVVLLLDSLRGHGAGWNEGGRSGGAVG